MEDASHAPFCCGGCRAVHDLLTSEHLDRYYDLRGPRGVPVSAPVGARHDSKWIDAVDEARSAVPGTCRVDLDVQGIHCSACVWLMERVFERQGGGAGLSVNPAIGRVQMLVDRDFDLRRFVSDVERFGYRFGPPLKEATRRSSELVWRLGVCIAIAMNTMIFALATYLGLREGFLYDSFMRINLALSGVAVLVGGSVFFRSAWQGLRRGYLHLDLPIAVGIALAFGGSVYSYASHRGSGLYVDTLNVFIALMLVGRWLQERVLERNRLTLLQNDGADGLLARRLRGARVETVKCTELRAGDRLLVAPGDLVPAACRLETVPGDVVGRSFSLDWINGECDPRELAPDAPIPAGAFSAEKVPLTLVLLEDFDASPLVELLRTPAPRAEDAAMSAPWWSRLSRVYVIAVLAAAAIGFAGWWLATRDLARSLEVTTALLVVTCPCAFGIATPLGYDLVLAGLRRAGLYVRSPGFLDRATRVRKVVFDKTGTLTLGTLDLVNPEALERLDPEQRRMLATAAASSNHPKSAPLLRHLDAPIEPDARVLVGPSGVSVHHGDREYRLGRADWVAGGPPTEADLAFGVDGVLLAAMSTQEVLRPDARREVAALHREGYEIWLLSGDSEARTLRAATSAGIPAARAIGSRTTQQKQAWVAEHDRGDLLMIGDGVNDSLVVAEATCGGTPSIERPFLAARSDFYFVTPGLSPVRLALRAATRMAGVRRRNLSLALAYNVLTVALAYAGLMSPVACAVLMPVSSLTTVLSTIASLSPRSSLWKS